MAQPVQRAVTNYLEMSGTVRAIESVEIRARVEGFLQSFEFEEGDVVSEGDLLYLIDPREYQAQAERAEAALATETASLALAKATLSRHRAAYKTRAVSELEVLESRAKRDVAAAGLSAAEAVLRKARLDLSYTKIRAPITGRIGRNLVDPGNLVGAGEKTLLTTIVRYDPIYAYFTLSERDVLELSDATDDVRAAEDRLERLREIPVELGRSNDEGYPFRGHLHFAESGIDPETGTYLIRGIFPNPQPVRLLPGIFARGRLPIGESEGALLVSDRALGADQSGRYLLVVDDEQVARYRPVEVGALVDGMRVIETGLEPEDWVITSGLLRARPGATVTPQRAAAVAAGPPSRAKRENPRAADADGS